MDFLFWCNLTFEVRTDAIKRGSASATCLSESFIHLMPWMNHASLCCLCGAVVLCLPVCRVSTLPYAHMH